ncbi:MAG: hypothetical protein ACPG5P_09130, partial [Saprospiraceae bacterium]
MKYLSLSLFLSLVYMTCGQQTAEPVSTIPQKEEIETMEYNPQYDFNQPIASQELPKKLMEISALTLDGDGGLLAVQDENGSIFSIKGEEIEETTFHKDGDYEGIEKVGDDVWVVKNTGTLYQISGLGTMQQKRKKHSNFLDQSYDIEGLCFDKKTNSLLLACKAGENWDDEFRGIFRFDLKTEELDSIPYFKISLPAIRDEVKMSATTRKIESFRKFLEGQDGEMTFAPSAIAIHPITDEIYITSSKGKLLLICNRKGGIIHIEKLEKSVHR